MHASTSTLTLEQTAARLGASVEAVELAWDAEFVDLHVDTFIPARLWGYDPFVAHSNNGPLGGRLFGHFDLPRATTGGLKGAMWSITTNPLRTRSGRWSTFQRNLTHLREWIGQHPEVGIARTHAEYMTLRAQGRFVVLLAVQGANAFEGAPDGILPVAHELLRVTLIHLTNSGYGASSSPANRLRTHRGLSPSGLELVRQLNAHRILVDLAHIHPKGFWDAVGVHDRTQPLVVTHTGVAGVRPHWRNIDDAQIRAVADTGGTIGIIFEPTFLRPDHAPNDHRLVVDHLDHVVSVVGEDHVSIGSDYDGNIVPPPDLRNAGTYPRLVQEMLNRGWSEVRISKALGGNFLRVLRQIRP